MKIQDKFSFTVSIIALILSSIVLINISHSCQKEQEMIDDPEPYLIIDKKVKFEGQRKVGSQIKFWVNMPDKFNNDLQWYFDYGHSTHWVAGTDTVYYTYSVAGVYYVLVTGWNTDHTKIGFSDAAKLQILD